MKRTLLSVFVKSAPALEFQNPKPEKGPIGNRRSRLSRMTLALWRNISSSPTPRRIRTSKFGPRISFGFRTSDFGPWTLVPVLLVAFSLLLAGCRPARNPADMPGAKVTRDTVLLPTNSPQLTQLIVETIGAEERAFVPLTGRLVWDEDVTVRVFTPFAGIVRKLLAEVGQPVAKGMLLAQMQSADFGQAQADARKAESDFRLAERNLTRLRDLFDHGAAAKKDLDAAEADHDRARVEKARAESRLAIYGGKDENEDQVFLLPSPLDGTIVDKNVTPGQEVRPDQMLANVPQFTAPLFVVSDPARLWVWLDLTEIQLPLVHKGQELTLRSKAFPDRVFKGRLDLIGDSLDATTRTIRARGSVENPEKLLKAELYVTVEIQIGRAHV